MEYELNDLDDEKEDISKKHGNEEQKVQETRIVRPVEEREVREEGRKKAAHSPIDQ